MAGNKAPDGGQYRDASLKITLPGKRDVDRLRCFRPGVLRGAGSEPPIEKPAVKSRVHGTICSQRSSKSNHRTAMCRDVVRVPQGRPTKI